MRAEQLRRIANTAAFITGLVGTVAIVSARLPLWAVFICGFATCLLVFGILYRQVGKL